jgi:hypothetical protein
MSLTASETAKRYGVTEQHIRKLLGGQPSVIKGEKRGPIWLVNEQSAAAYFAKERHPGPKPKAKPHGS